MTNDDVLKKLEQRREMVSALADGQLRGQDFAKAVESIHSDTESGLVWQSYHVIGDVLRSPELAEQAGDVNFLARFQSRLATDSEAQRAYVPVSSLLDANGASKSTVGPKPSANESTFRWKLAAVFASLAAVVAIGWTMTYGLNGSAGSAQLAQGLPAPQLTLNASPGAEPTVMIRDPNLDALLAAHKQFGGATALQMPTGFLRNATFEGGSR